MTFKYRYRKQIIIATTCFLILVVSITSTVYYFSTNKKKVPKNNILIKTKSTTSKKEESSIYYKVDIKGEVITPGIYTLKEESRIIDVIEVAGGLTENANTTVINLSKKITDEMVIIIYSNREVEDFKKTKELEKKVIDNCIQKDENALKNDACIEQDTIVTTNTKVSINKATLEELMTLTGIGEAKAKDIIKYREEHGDFKSIEDLKNVNGIGDSIFDKIKESITI